MRRSLWLLSTLLLVALAGSCASGQEAALAPTATLGTAPTTTPAPAEPPPDPAVIPDDPADIDEDYVQAVVDALFAVDAKAAEEFLASGAVNEAGMGLLRTIYVGEELDQQENIWNQSLAARAQELLPGFLENNVMDVIDVAKDCVFFEVQVDYTNTTTKSVAPTINYLGITSRQDEPDLVNTTAWVLFTNGVNLDGSQPENPCAGR